MDQHTIPTDMTWDEALQSYGEEWKRLKFGMAPMETTIAPNDMSAIIEADRAHVWHHLLQHKPLRQMMRTISEKYLMITCGLKQMIYANSKT